MTRREMPHEFTPGKYSGRVSLVAFVICNLDSAGHRTIVNAKVPPDVYLRLDIELAHTRTTFVNLCAALAQEPLAGEPVSESTPVEFR